MTLVTICNNNIVEQLKTRFGNKKLHLLVDAQVERLYPEIISQIDWASVYSYPAQESNKNIEWAIKIWDYWLNNGVKRDSIVVNLGGGVTTDIGGFCASTFMRGVTYINIPTTTLAMVDAAIGGKTGIDFNNFKNLIGSFHLPMEVFIDPKFMNTLPEIELQSGFAEILKYALIADKNLYDILNEWDGYVPSVEIIEKCIALKSKYVTEDLLDNGIRMHLNFGHTIGHAIEKEYLAKRTPLPHGFAVAEGMIAETEIAIEKKLIQTSEAEKIIKLIIKFFPNRIEYNKDLLLNNILTDKKNTESGIRMVLPVEIGRVEIFLV